MDRAVVATLVGVLFAVPQHVSAQTLKGSSRTMQRQNRVAVQHDYTFLQTSSEVRKFVASGYLVHLPGNADYELAAVSHPYARPAVRTFVERLGRQYRSACGEKLVLTSLTRPAREQPRNASDLSVHPAGMAVDLRVSQRPSCRQWLEKTLLSLEKQGILDVTREKRPPHYHVALFPNAYERYLASLPAARRAPVRVAATAPAEPARTTRVTSNVPATPAPAKEPVRQQPQPAVDRAAEIVASATPAPPSQAHVEAAPDGARDAEPADAAPPVAEESAAEVATVQRYRVARGETMWSIARRHGTTVEMIMALNGLLSPELSAGQLLTVPIPQATADASR